jgi:1-aminocyclopropane-1-carboxylate deaminase/D-cysteine desulfhydrase-like pyridoxal-dependent ACC family enzyme
VTGALGYVAAMSEILDDEVRLGVSFDAIVVTSSSAGTQAGLVVGKAIAGWPGQILGISVAKDTASLQQEVWDLAQATADRLQCSIDRHDVQVDDAFLGEAYACRTAACDEAVTLFSRRCGIFLDYVYTGKGAAGLLHYLRTDRFAPGSSILFVHTGGAVELLA